MRTEPLRDVNIDPRNGAVSSEPPCRCRLGPSAHAALEHLERGRGLTPRERQVLHALLSGLEYKEIAQAHRVSVATVRRQVHTVYGKLGVDSAKMVWQRFIALLQ